MIKKKILPSAVQSITLHWDFQDEAVNSTERQKDRQKSARNLVIIEIDPSVPRAEFSDPKRDNRHRATLNQCDCNDFTRLKVPKPCMHIYRLAIELGRLEAKYLDSEARAKEAHKLFLKRDREETQRLQRLPTDSKEWGYWALEIHATGPQRNRQYKGYSIYHVEHSLLKSAKGWLKHDYSLTLEHCDCPDFFDRGLPCKHIYAAALASSISLQFTYAEFDAARKKSLERVFTF
jgi:predicted nucleic acid-binding Zn finger protein